MGPGQTRKYRLPPMGPQPPAASGPRRTLIFGGTFDPPHQIHVRAARAAADTLGCQSILVIPAGRSPLKEWSPLFTDEQRLALARDAFSSAVDARFEVLDTEIKREGPSFTIDTLDELFAQRCLDASATFLLIGSDQARRFSEWRECDRLLRDRAILAIVTRPPSTRAEDEAVAQALPPGRAIVVPLDPVDLSSTAVREALASGRIPRDSLPPAVAARLESWGFK